MWRVVAQILLLVLGIVLVQTDWLTTLGGSAGLGWFIFGAALAMSVGLIVFRLRVWGETTQGVFNARPASLQPGPSSAQGCLNGILALGMSLGVIATAIVTALEYEGRHDLVMQSLEFIVSKMGKIVNALTH